MLRLSFWGSETLELLLYWFVIKAVKVQEKNKKQKNLMFDTVALNANQRIKYYQDLTELSINQQL